MSVTGTGQPASARSARIALTGDLDYDTADQLWHEIARQLDTRPDLAALHLDCTHLRFCDSYGLGVLLAAHRRLTTARVRLLLDHRPRTLDRLLTVTGTLAHLTGTPELRQEKGLDP